MGHWCNKWLSLGGKFILVKSILENIPAYWLSMPRIPSSILDIIRRMIFNFLWSHQKDKEGIHLVRWDILARLKDDGGLGIKNIYHFGESLAVKSLWRGIFSIDM